MTAWNGAEETLPSMFFKTVKYGAAEKNTAVPFLQQDLIRKLVSQSVCKKVFMYFLNDLAKLYNKCINIRDLTILYPAFRKRTNLSRPVWQRVRAALLLVIITI